ncbi:MAG: DUF2946 family protein, partial [Burkholderiaceae bacterium]
MPPRALRLFASWIALAAVVAVTFMPTVSQWLSAGRDGIDVCSVGLAGDSGTPAPGERRHHAFDHCPYCALHADLALPPQPATDGAPVVVPFLESPRAFLQAPRATGV